MTFKPSKYLRASRRLSLGWPRTRLMVSLPILFPITHPRSYVLLGYPFYIQFVLWVSFGSLFMGLSLAMVNYQHNSPEFANIMYDIGSVPIALLIAYLNFGPSQSSIFS